MIFKNFIDFILLETRSILDTGVVENLARRVKGMINNNPNGNLAKITCAASLAYHGLLDSVLEMWLWDVNLTSVPTEHLASLVSRVTWHVYIKNISGCDLVVMMDSVNSKRLSICKQSLGCEETQALVRAMELRVEKVALYHKMTLDISVLMEYSVQGKCRSVKW